MRINWTKGYKDVEVTDDSYRLRRIMGENKVTLKFSLPEFIEFPLGAFINYQGQKYTLNTPQTINEINSTHFEYTLIFGSHQDLLKNYKLKDTQGRLKFPLTATPREHLEVLVNVLNTYDSGWSIGDCITNTEKLISYNHTNCYEALQMITNEFKTEWELVGKVIHLRKVEYNKDNPLPLSYGKGNGFVSGVGRNNDEQKAGFNVLYIQGGAKNIDRSKYGSKELLLPKSKEYTYEGITYITDAKGLFITQKGVVIGNRKEESLDCSHIYPQRVGTVSEVIVVDAEKHFYDFKDNSIPDDLDFSQCRMNGEKITIQFNSGMLSGREFEIQQEEDSMSGYVHAERRFKLVPQEEDGYTMPNDTFKPELGDKYAVFGMMMPDAYISDDATQTGASWEMFKEACKHFYENHESKFTFKGTLDGIWAKKDWINIGGRITIGGFVAFSDVEFQKQGINIRIVSVKDYINNPHSPIIELANSVQGGSIASELDKIRENEIVREDLHKRSLDFTKRRFRDTQETIKMLEKAQLDFGKSINPLTINTMGILVGNQASQFVFVVSKANPTEIEHNFIYDKATKQLKAEAGTIKHISNTDILTTTNTRTYRYWNVPSYISAILDDATKSYYLYAKASKSNETATFILSKNAIKLEEVTGYYHLLVGVLNSEFEEERSFVKLYGFSEYLPSQLKINRLTGQGLDINLLTGEIKGRVTFSSSSPALAQTKAISETAKQQAIYTSSLDATNKVNVAEEEIKAANLKVLEAKALVLEEQARAYADGKVTAEEQRAIADAKAKLAQAEAKAKELVDAVEIGSNNVYSTGDYYREMLSLSNANVGNTTLRIEGNKRILRYDIATSYRSKGGGGRCEYAKGLFEEGSYTISFLGKGAGRDSDNYYGSGIGVVYTDESIDYISTETVSWVEKSYTTPADKTIAYFIVYYHSSRTVEIANLRIYKGTKDGGDNYSRGDIAHDIAEARKIKAPYINTSNGNWMLYNVETGTYVDSGKTSKGDDGHPPKIVSGYWHEWDAVAKVYKNTGIKAKGDKGDKGDKGNRGDKGDKGDRGEMIEGGKMLYTDPTFKKGVNGTHTYNNSGGSAVVWRRVQRPPDAPMTSSHILQYKYNGGATSPGFGGFHFANLSRANAVFLAKIIAKIPAGRKIEFATNPVGDGSKYTWLSSQAGTGKYETYIHRVECGATGAFSLTNYFYFNGGANTAFTVDIAFATVYDLTEYENLQEQIAEQRAEINKAKAITDKFGTTVQGGLVQSVMMSLRGANTTTETAGISGIQGTNKTNPAFWAGGTYAQALQAVANIVLRHNGEGKIGGLYVDADGTVRSAANEFVFRKDGSGKIGSLLIGEGGTIYTQEIINGKEVKRVQINSDKLPDLYQLINGAEVIRVVQKESVNYRNSTTDIITNGLQVLHDGSEVTIKFNMLTWLLSLGGSGSSNAIVDLMKDGNPYRELTRLVIGVNGGINYNDLMLGGSSGGGRNPNQEQVQDSVVVDTVLLGMPRGVYTLRLRYHQMFSGYVQAYCNIGSIYLKSLFRVDLRQITIGLDGIQAFYGRNKFFSINDRADGKPFIAGRGNIDLPGVLACGTVTAWKATTNLWGAKNSNSPVINRLGQGKYRVSHEVGHSNYVIQATPHDIGVNITIKERQSTYFEVYIQQNGYYFDTGFDYVLFGRNY